MVDQVTRADPTPGRDRSVRTAVFWATAIAVPVAVLVGWLLLSMATRPATPRAQSTAPVSVPAPALTGQPVALCRTLVADLPGPAIRDLPRRPVTSGAEQSAAYGDPAITLACGVPAPAVAATDDVFLADGVCWHAGGPDKRTFTTADRTVPVRVTVPASYEGPVQWVNEFSAAVARTVPRTTTVPAGCAG